MRKPSEAIVNTRRRAIVDAAVAAITESGLENLSLSAIESRAGMSRGQLTYYFPTKEEILLAVFDRVVEMMHERARAASGQQDGCGACPGGWPLVQFLLARLLLHHPMSPAFQCLQYTFLAQMGHRDDFRDRLANLYEEWRSRMGSDLAADLKETPHQEVPPRALATVVQALMHGLAMQLAVDPNAFDREEVLDLCLDLLGSYLHLPRSPVPAPANGTAPHPTAAKRRGKSKRKGRTHV